jgi:hypothetical protein
MERDLGDVFCPHFQNHHRHHSLDVLKIKHLELSEKMEYTVTGAIILILYLESLIQRERKSKPTLHLIP